MVHVPLVLVKADGPTVGIQSYKKTWGSLIDVAAVTTPAVGADVTSSVVATMPLKDPWDTDEVSVGTTEVALLAPDVVELSTNPGLMVVLVEAVAVLVETVVVMRTPVVLVLVEAEVVRDTLVWVVVVKAVVDIDTVVVEVVEEPVDVVGPPFM